MANPRKVLKVDVGPSSTSPSDTKITCTWQDSVTMLTGQDVIVVAKASLVAQDSIEVALTAADNDLDWSL